jgi:hypothetical protein
MRLARVVSILGAGLLVTAALAGTGAPPLYGRLALPPQGAQTVAFMLRGSQDPLLRDVLYVDRNANGRFESAEKLLAQPGEYQSAEYRECKFASVDLPADAPRGTLPCRLQVTCLVFGAAATAQAVCALELKWSQSGQGAAWSYAAAGALQPTTPGATKRETAPLLGATGPVGLQITTRPDPEREGKTGIGVTLGWPSMKLEVTQSPTPVTVELTIKDPGGKSQHSDTVPLASCGFG